MPEAADECVLDASRYTQDMIGKKITISSENSEDTRDSFVYDTYTVTGLVRSPLYLNMERGTTTIGKGKIDALFLYPRMDFPLIIMRGSMSVEIPKAQHLPKLIRMKLTVFQRE